MSGDSAGFIVVWNTSTWERRGRLSGHSDAVSCLLSCNARVISGSYDRSIKVWNPASWQCERILLHSRAVTCLLQTEDKMLSGSYDKTIKVWNTRNWSCEHTLQEHVSYVTCLSNCRGKVLSGSRDNTIKVWDAKTWKCIRQLSAHNNAISCFLNCGDKLLSCSVDNTFKVWNPFTWECEKSITQDRGTSNKAIIVSSVDCESLTMLLTSGFYPAVSLNVAETSCAKYQLPCTIWRQGSQRHQRKVYYRLEYHHAQFATNKR